MILFQNRIRALEGLGFKPEDNAHVQMILIPLLEMKLPQYLVEEWELELSGISDEKITIDRFFRFLNRQLVSKEPGQRGSIENALASSQGDHHSHSFKRKVDRSRPGNMGKRNRPVISSASALVSGVKQQPDSSCAFVERKIMKQFIVHKPRRKQLMKDGSKQKTRNFVSIV